MARCVVALDPTVRKVSAARVSDDKPTPTVGATSSIIPVQKKCDDGKLIYHRDVRAVLLRARGQMDDVVDKVAAYEPELVVMVSPTMNDLRRDPSAPRRLGLWWMLADRLDTAKLPLVEIPPLTIQRIWLGHAEFGMSGVEALTNAVYNVWPEVKAEVKKTKEYRTTTVAAAAVGALVMGIDVPGFEPAVEDWGSALSKVFWPRGIGPGKPLGSLASSMESA
jgi:hypothetical protein